MPSTLVKAGCCREVTPMNGDDFSLIELKSLIGGDICVNALLGNKVIVYDKEGWRNNKPINIVATQMLVVCGQKNFVAGPALVVEQERVRRIDR